MIELGDMMREILREYHECIEQPTWVRGVYVKPAMYASYPFMAFILSPFDMRHGKQFMVRRSYDNMWWEFQEIPF